VKEILNLAGFYGELEESEGAGTIEIKRDVVAFERSSDLGEVGGSVFGERKVYEGGSGLKRGPKINLVFGLVERHEAQLDAGVRWRTVEGDVEEETGNGDQKDGALAGVTVVLQRTLGRLDIEVPDPFGRDGAVLLELGTVTGADHALAGAFHAAHDATLVGANRTHDIKIVGIAAIDDDGFKPGLVGSVVGRYGSSSEAH